MNSKEFEEKSIELEKRLLRASKQYHRCLGIVLEKFLIKEPGYEDVTHHCIDQKKRVDTLLTELKDYH